MRPGQSRAELTEFGKVGPEVRLPADLLATQVLHELHATHGSHLILQPCKTFLFKLGKLCVEKLQGLQIKGAAFQAQSKESREPVPKYLITACGLKDRPVKGLTDKRARDSFDPQSVPGKKRTQ